MQLLEHHGKRMLAAGGGIKIPRGTSVTDRSQVEHAAQHLGSEVVLKAQVPIGGRGKSGGVQIVPRKAAADCAARLLGTEINGFPVTEVLVEEKIASERELYLAIALSHRIRSVVLLLSSEGGVDVEHSGHDMAVVPLPALIGLRDFHVREAARAADLSVVQLPGLIEAARAAYELFMRVEADLVEINPLFQVEDGGLVAGDVRVIPADAGAYSREHPRSPATVAEHARSLGFDLVELDPLGEVGLLSTGAGLSMLVVDLLVEAGIRPINFCDVRSGRAAGAEQRLGLVLDYLAAAPALRCLAINFFIGVTDFEAFSVVLAESLTVRPLDVPMVVRLEGPGAGEARQRLQDVGATVVDGLDDLVREVTRVVQTDKAVQ